MPRKRKTSTRDRHFEESAPAAHIFELLDYLRGTDQGQYLYRGQTKHHGKLFSSMVRKALTGETYNDDPMLARLNRDGFRNVLDERWRIRSSFLTELIRNHGKGPGNLIAQQYGVGSEALDVTSDAEIAAFFATRPYPKYEHFCSPAKRSVGVIYRFPKIGVVDNLLELEHILGAIGYYLGEAIDAPVWFNTSLTRSWLSQSDQEKVDRYLADHGSEEQVLFTHPIIVEYAHLDKGLIESFTKFKGLNLKGRSFFNNTRFARQKSGFIIPRFFWKCTIPANRKIAISGVKNGNVEVRPITEMNTDQGRKMFCFMPDTAIKEELLAVEDAMNFPGLEVFFFYHSQRAITSTCRKDMWPSSDEDDVYDRLTTMCLFEQTISEYVESNDIWLEHPDKGILDRGFYTGTEEIAWKARQAFNGGKHDEAIALVSQAIVKDEKNDDLFVLRGFFYHQLGKVDQALLDFEEALRCNPKNWNAYAGKGGVKSEQHDHISALENLDKAISLQPGRSISYFNRADIYARTHNYQAAVDDLTMAREVLCPSSLYLRKPILQLQALTYTAWGKDAEAEQFLLSLDKITNTSKLRQHIEKMRRGRKFGTESA